jgi:hypothetical protein
MRKILEKELITEYKRLEEELKRPVTFADLEKLSIYNENIYCKRFGSLTNFRQLYRFKRPMKLKPWKHIPERLLFEEIKRLKELLGRNPSPSEINKCGNYSLKAFMGNCGGNWKLTKEKFFIEAKNRLGTKHSLETRKKMSMAKKDIYNGKNNPMYGKRFWGKSNPNFKGGITKIAECIRSSTKYAEWRWNIYKRDNFKCQDCGVNNKTLNAHHIKPFRSILKEFLDKNKGRNQNKLTSLAFEYNDFWETKNGITLCSNCHENYRKKGGDRNVHMEIRKQCPSGQWSIQYGWLNNIGQKKSCELGENPEMDNPEPSLGRKPLEGVTTSQISNGIKPMIERHSYQAIVKRSAGHCKHDVKHCGYTDDIVCTQW